MKLKIIFFSCFSLAVSSLTFGQFNTFDTSQGSSGGTNVYQTLPGTSVRDYSKPGMKVQKSTFGGGTNVYQTLPGTSIRDYSKPGWKIEKK